MSSHPIVYFILLTVFLLLWWFRWRIRYWAALLLERGWYNTLHYDRCVRIINRLYKDTHPYRLSIEERKAKGLAEDSTLTYGEVTFYNFVRILESAKLAPGQIFYDLGSGSGKAVMIAGLVFNLAKACGIEKLESLYDLSVSVCNRLYQIPEYQQFFSDQKTQFEFIQGDFLEHDISNADCVFINATCFRNEIWTKIANRLVLLPSGCRVIIASQALPTGIDFALTYCNSHLMSWGMSRISIYERL